MTSLFTPAYIAMAKTAEEIQAMRPKVPNDSEPCPDLGSFFISNTDELNVMHWDNDEGRWMIGGYMHHAEGTVAEWPWLPRLDQLLGMFEPLLLGIYGLNIAYKNKCLPLPSGPGGPMNPGFYISQFENPIEIALDFYMGLNHGKRWDGEGWVKC